MRFFISRGFVAFCYKSPASISVKRLSFRLSLAQTTECRSVLFETLHMIKRTLQRSRCLHYKVLNTKHYNKNDKRKKDAKAY